MSLFEPYWMSENKGKLDSISRKLKKEKYEKLENIVLNAPSFDVKALALDHIWSGDMHLIFEKLDKDDLKSIIPKMKEQWKIVDDMWHYSDEMLCLIATLLTDEDDIVKYGHSCFNKSAAEILVANITNQGLLMKLIGRYSTTQVFEAVAKRIDDPLFFADCLIQNECCYETYDYFVSLGGTIEMLMSFLPEDVQPFYFPEEAVKNIEDKDFLARIIIYCQNREAKEAAVDKLQEDWQLCYRLYQDERLDKDGIRGNLLEATIKNTDDQNLINNLAMYSEFWDVREMALEYVKDRKTLLKIASGDRDSIIRDKAKEMLGDSGLDDYIQENCRHSGTQHVLYDFDEYGSRKTLAAFSICRYCGNISLISTFVPDISEECPIACDEKHVFYRRHIDVDHFGERVAYQCNECRQSIYGYEEWKGM